MRSQKPAPANWATVPHVLEARLAGLPAPKVQNILNRLPTRLERQTALCTACGVAAEATASCRERGQEISAFLAANCKIFEPSRMPCMLQQVYGTSLEQLPTRSLRVSQTVA